MIKIYRPQTQTRNNTIGENEWYEHYRSFYETNILQDNIRLFGAGQESLDAEFTESEILSVLKKIKNKKSPGPDAIGNEIYKYIDNVDYLQSLFNMILETECIPKDWSSSKITSIFKKGDRNDPNCYRGIALISTLTKIFTQLLTARISNWAEKEHIIPEEQAGFRKGRGYVDQIFTLNALIQMQLRHKSQKLYACFVDFRRCFDLLVHKIMWQKLYSMGVSPKLIRLFQALFKNATCKMQLNNAGECTAEIKITKGILQGESASPLLFSLVITDIVDYLRNRGC